MSGVRQTMAVPSLVAAIVLGLWVFAAPEVLGFDGPSRVAHLVLGPLIVSVALIAVARAVRLLVRANLVLGGLLALSAALAPAVGVAAESVLVGVGVAVLGLVPTSMAERFGGGWLAVLRGLGGQDREGAAAQPDRNRSGPHRRST